jgi:hypothetical protein
MEKYIKAKEDTDKALENFEKKFDNRFLDLRVKGDELMTRHSKLILRRAYLSHQYGGRANIQGSDIIKINAGGTILTTRRDTLTAIEGSQLEVLFSGRLEDKLLRDHDGCVFMDVDPDIFKKIIEYLYMVKSAPCSDSRPKLPTVEFKKRQILYLYLEFFGICDDLKSACSDTDIVDNVTTVSDTDYNDVIVAFQKEKRELIQLEMSLDRMEANLEINESFFDLFTVGFVKHASYNIDEPFPSVQSYSNNKSTVWEGFSFIVDETKRLDQDVYSILDLQLDNEIITVRRSTLCSYLKNSVMAKQFSDDKWIQEKSISYAAGKVTILIEYPPTIFKTIISQLRLCSMMQSGDNLPRILIDDHEESILMEQVLLQLFPENIECILGGHSHLKSSILKSPLERHQIMTWLTPLDKEVQPMPIYQTSVDGWKIDDFHTKCDGEGATISIIQTTEGYTFGGYSDQSWKHSMTWKRSNESFLFSIQCFENLSPMKMELKPEKFERAVNADSSFGPWWGDGPDLRIGSNGWDLKEGYVSIGKTYMLPNGASTKFLTGKNGHNDEFQLAGLEVFKVLSKQKFETEANSTVTQKTSKATSYDTDSVALDPSENCYQIFEKEEEIIDFGTLFSALREE